MSERYVCTHCGWVGTEPQVLPLASDDEGPWCPRCPYMVVSVSALARVKATLLADESQPISQEEED